MNAALNDSAPAPIQQPPLNLTNDHSCLKRGCSFAVGLVLVAGAAMALAAWFFAAPPAELRATLPPSFPNAIPIFRFDERDSITYLPGDAFNNPWRKRLTAVKLAAGKIMVSARLMSASTSLLFNDQTIPFETVSLDSLKQFLTTDYAAPPDTVIIVWDNLNSSPAAVSKFYKDNFGTQDFFYIESLNEHSERTVTFSKKTIDGRVTIAPDTNNPQSSARVELRVRFGSGNPVIPSPAS